MPTSAIVSFRLGGSDGVSIEAAKWAGALGALGFDVVTVAGAGPVDHRLPGLAMGADEPPAPAEIARALDGADVVVVENLCSLPLNPAAARAVAAVLAGRPAVLHHHDLPWQRPHLAHHGAPPDDPAWAHVTINELSRRQLARHGIEATTIYNAFDPDPRPGDRSATRTTLGLGERDRLVLQPTRALERKNIPGGLAVAEAVGGTYWLLGPAEDGYGPELARLVTGARCHVVLGLAPGHGADPMGDAYAACDVVALPSTWEGFGNPSVESAVRDRPLAIGPYPVAAELAAFGFEWFECAEGAGLAALGAWLDRPDEGLLARNHDIARRHFDLHRLPERIGPVLESVLHR